jgi:hypothetical protein
VLLIRASLSLSGSVRVPPFPWLYPYQEDGPRLDQIVQRPIVSTALVSPSGEVSDGLYALVDSGCHHVLAAPWLADAAGVDPKATARELDLGIGGTTVKVRFSDLRIRLLAPDGTDDQYFEWEAEVGFFDEWRPTFAMILGQRGFFDQFTVTMNLFSLQTAVEPLEEFDSRFGVPLAPSHPQSLRSRFR